MAKAQGNDLVQAFSSVAVGTDYLPIRVMKPGFPLRGTIWVTGTFTGTIVLEGSAPDNNSWGAIAGASFTTPTSASVLFGADEDVRINATALSAGTANVWLKVTQ